MGDKSSINLIGSGLLVSGQVFQFHGISQGEFINDRFGQFPEILVHADGLDGAVDRSEQVRQEVADLVDALAVDLDRLYQDAGIIAHCESQRSAMQIRPDQGHKLGGHHDQTLFVS